jgi:hypothetical protein
MGELATVWNIRRQRGHREIREDHLAKQLESLGSLPWLQSNRGDAQYFPKVRVLSGKRKTGTGQRSGFVTMTAPANLNRRKYQRIDRSPSSETDECSAAIRTSPIDI